MALRLMDAGQPAHIRIQPQGRRKRDPFIAERRRFARLGFMRRRLPGHLFRDRRRVRGPRLIRNHHRPGFGWRLYRLANPGSREQNDLDAGRDAPGFLTFESEGGEGLGEGLAQAEAIKQVQRRALRVLRIDRFGQ